jgi:hypothetical protein
LPLLLGTAVQYLTWQLDLEWLRRPLPVFPAIFPWTIVLFFATSLILVFLALAVRTGSVRYQAIGKALGLLIGLITIGFLLEYALRNPVSTFDKWFFPELLYKAGGSFPGRPALQTCVTFFLLAFATLVFDRKDKRRIESLPDRRDLGHVLAAGGDPRFFTVCHRISELGSETDNGMAIPTLILLCIGWRCGWTGLSSSHFPCTPLF